MTLTVLPNAVLLNVSRQLIEDAEFDVTAIVMEDFQQAWNLRMDTAAFVGSGHGGRDGRRLHRAVHRRHARRRRRRGTRRWRRWTSTMCCDA